MTGSGCTQEYGLNGERYLEPAVPFIAFGITIAGILLWGAGVRIDFQYFSVGCLAGSCILSYLAWIRPRKDIVALSTPVYGIVFLCTPVDASAGAVIQLLYAAGLTILLFRLKRRFGSGTPCPDHILDREPLGHYRNRLIAAIPPVPPGAALTAGRIFILFANGEFEQARLLATSGTPPSGEPTSDLLCRAFAIIAEQADIMVRGSATPREFSRFLPEQDSLLFHPAGAARDPEQQYSTVLDNALILLYVVAVNNRETGGEILDELDRLLPFARRLCGE